MDRVKLLHEHLFTVLRETGSSVEEITVADLYEELIPYRTARNAISAAMSADYQEALIRMLAGEGGYVQVAPAVAAVLLAELAKPYPDLSVYRRFDDSLVTVIAPVKGMDVQTCPSCGSRLPDRATVKFCPKCGTPVRSL